MGKSEGIKK